MTFEELQEACSDYLIAVTIATELPPDAPIEEFRAVIDVIRNRIMSKRWGVKPVYTVLARNQFSAVCREEYWRRAIAGDWIPKHVERCLELWHEEWEDTTDGATHYYSPISMIPQWSEPNWAPSMTEVEVPGTRKTHFRFYK